MELTKLSISYGRTENLGNFSNVRPEVTLEAVLHAGDTLEAAREVLLREARAIVEAEIDDALERVDVPARYDATSPRFWVFATKPKHWGGPTYQPLPGTVAIVPASIASLGNDWYQVSIGDQRKHPVRLRHARAVTQRYANENEGYTIADCSDGDLSRLPQRETKTEEVENVSAPAPENTDIPTEEVENVSVTQEVENVSTPAPENNDIPF